MLYNNAKLILKQYDETVTQIKNSIDTLKPRLTIAYTSLDDIKLLLPFISHINEINFPVSIELKKVDCKDVDSFVKKGISDLGLSFGEEFKSHELSFVTLNSGHYKALVPKGHPLFEHKIISVKELYSFPLLMLSEDIKGESYTIMKERSIKDG
ncbi:hypothetical protein SUT007_09150 [Streptococcus parasuis]|nr:hypothetical protein SUT007_09150 [Streptococcus parasuis]